MGKIELETYKGWVKGKVYSDVSDYPRKYREFCALVSFSEENGEEKNYLPNSDGLDVSFKVGDLKVGDVVYMGYGYKHKKKTVVREYCKVLEITDECLVLEDGFSSYFKALES